MHCNKLCISIVQCIKEDEDGKEEIAPPILQLSSEKMTRYGIFLMDYGLVSTVVMFNTLG